MRNFNMKSRRTNKPSFIKHRSNIINNYKNTNPKNNITFNKKTNNCCNYNCAEQNCLNSIDILDVSLNVWSNELMYGKCLYPGTLVELKIGSKSKTTFGKIKEVNLSNCRGKLVNGNIDCSVAFKDSGININLLIEPTEKCSTRTLEDLKTEPDIIFYFNNKELTISSSSHHKLGNIYLINKPMKRIGAIYRLPIAGFRKTLCDNKNNIVTQEVYKDPYSLLFKNNPETYKNLCYQQTIRSGMQEKKQNIACNKKCCNKEKYNFSYSEYNKNYKLSTYDRNLEINKPLDGNTCLTGDCVNSSYVKSAGLSSTFCKDETCNNNKMVKTTWKPNNNKFKVQGSVTSGQRLERLKLDTIKVANSKCTDNKCKLLNNNETIGRGKYFAGKPRFDGWMFNKTHLETNKLHIYR